MSKPAETVRRAATTAVRAAQSILSPQPPAGPPLDSTWDSPSRDVALVRINTLSHRYAYGWTVQVLDANRNQIRELDGLMADKWNEIAARLKPTAVVVERARKTAARWAGESDGWVVLGTLGKVWGVVEKRRDPTSGEAHVEEAEVKEPEKEPELEY